MASIRQRSLLPKAPIPPEANSLPPLEPGDHLDQKTFHARYEAMPENVRAELIGGVVFMPSPLKNPHGRMHARLMAWLGAYEEATPGTDFFDNTTDIMGPVSEPQPDAILIVLPEKGGQTRENPEGWMEGPPEFIAEVASSTESYDLYEKKRDYEKEGVKEYLVVALRQAQVFWFISRQGKFELLPPGPDGILRSETFPGLWLDPASLLRRDTRRLLEVLRQGLASPEHAAWVAKLAGK
jgi:Uma2 family endonuclease